MYVISSRRWVSPTQPSKILTGNFCVLCFVHCRNCWESHCVKGFERRYCVKEGLVKHKTSKSLVFVCACWETLNPILFNKPFADDYTSWNCLIAFDHMHSFDKSGGLALENVSGYRDRLEAGPGWTGSEHVFQGL